MSTQALNPLSPRLPIPEEPRAQAIENELSNSKLKVPGENKPAASPETEKKKAHKGRRGGVKHKYKHKKRRATSQGASEDGTTAPKSILNLRVI
ncbi:hypothetical protein EG329_007808 [Mollisiaceae sp. DMI_Dod_QoI]|nr:hypothetical protein EG329_007808 [Helotiales sp. DMI_Dod_QoI]